MCLSVCVESSFVVYTDVMWYRYDFYSVCIVQWYLWVLKWLFALIYCRLQQYKLVEMKLLAQQRDLQVVIYSLTFRFIMYFTLLVLYISSIVSRYVIEYRGVIMQLCSHIISLVSATTNLQILVSVEQAIYDGQISQLLRC